MLSHYAIVRVSMRPCFSKQNSVTKVSALSVWTQSDRFLVESIPFL